MDEENKNYIATKLKHIIEPMITQILLQKPDNLAAFMLEYLQKNFKKDDSIDKR
jgi:predicted site-specific integrase-resolvase